MVCFLYTLFFKETFMPVSKTDFIRGLQCEKMLWLDAHAPELRIIPEEIRQRLDAGNDFGDKVMGVFGPFKETTAYKEDGRLDFAKMLAVTKTLLAAGERVICEGSFSWYGNFCAADILKKEETGYALYEVKNTSLVRREFIADLGFQRLILRKCGVNVTSSSLILRDEERDEEGEQVRVEHIQFEDLSLKIVDVTKQAKLLEREAEKRIFELGKLKRKDAIEPPIKIGEHCEKPYPCWYIEHCKGQK